MISSFLHHRMNTRRASLYHWMEQQQKQQVSSLLLLRFSPRGRGRDPSVINSDSKGPTVLLLSFLLCQEVLYVNVGVVVAATVAVLILLFNQFHFCLFTVFVSQRSLNNFCSCFPFCLRVHMYIIILFAKWVGGWKRGREEEK